MGEGGNRWLVERLWGSSEVILRGGVEGGWAEEGKIGQSGWRLGDGVGVGTDLGGISQRRGRRAS